MISVAIACLIVRPASGPGDGQGASQRGGGRGEGGGETVDRISQRILCCGNLDDTAVSPLSPWNLSAVGAVNAAGS